MTTKHEISQVIIPFLDPHLIDPILDFLKSKSLYDAEQINTFSKAIKERIMGSKPDRLASLILEKDWKKASEELVHCRDSLETKLQKVPLFSNESIQDRCQMFHAALFVHLKSQQPTQLQKIEQITPLPSIPIIEDDGVPLETEEEPIEEDSLEKKEADGKESKQQLTIATSSLIDLLFFEKHLNLIRTKCPHLFRYIGVGCVVNKNKRRIQLTNLLRIMERKEYIMLPQFEKDYSYEAEKDPILMFLHKLCIDVDFNGAIQALEESKAVVEADYFLQEIGNEFISKAKEMLFDIYRKVHRGTFKFNPNIVVASKELESEYAAYSQIVLLSKKAHKKSSADASKPQ